MAGITTEEWLAELERLRDTGPISANGYMTVSEIATALKIGDRPVRTLLQRLNKEGQLETSRRPLMAIDGSMRNIPVYRIKRKKGKAS